jgi:hypothetical protein
MSTRDNVRNLLFCTTDYQHRRLSATHGEVASVGVMQGESTDRSRRFVWSDRPVSVELEPAAAEPQPPRAAWPVWVSGTLIGVMAKPRPAWPVWANGTLFGVMAEQRPAPRPFGSN